LWGRKRRSRLESLIEKVHKLWMISNSTCNKKTFRRMQILSNELFHHLLIDVVYILWYSHSWHSQSFQSIPSLH
jgi:hypothetical protein